MTSVGWRTWMISVTILCLGLGITGWLRVVSHAQSIADHSAKHDEITASSLRVFLSSLTLPLVAAFATRSFAISSSLPSDPTLPSRLIRSMSTALSASNQTLVSFLAVTEANRSDYENILSTRCSPVLGAALRIVNESSYPDAQSRLQAPRAPSASPSGAMIVLDQLSPGSGDVEAGCRQSGMDVSASTPRMVAYVRSMETGRLTFTEPFLDAERRVSIAAFVPVHAATEGEAGYAGSATVAFIASRPDLNASYLWSVCAPPLGIGPNACGMSSRGVGAVAVPLQLAGVLGRMHFALPQIKGSHVSLVEVTAARMDLPLTSNDPYFPQLVRSGALMPLIPDSDYIQSQLQAKYTARVHKGKMAAIVRTLPPSALLHSIYIDNDSGGPAASDVANVGTEQQGQCLVAMAKADEDPHQLQSAYVFLVGRRLYMLVLRNPAGAVTPEAFNLSVSSWALGGLVSFLFAVLPFLLYVNDANHAKKLKHTVDLVHAERDGVVQAVAFAAHEIRNPLHGVLASLESALADLKPLHDLLGKLLTATSQSGPRIYKAEDSSRDVALTEDEAYLMHYLLKLLGQDDCRNAFAGIEDVTVARDSAENCHRLVNDMVDYSKLQRGVMSMQIAPMNVRDALRRCMQGERAFMDPAVRSWMGIHRNVPTNLLTDEMRVLQVVTNSLTNAGKFTFHGNIWLTACVVDTSAHPSLCLPHNPGNKWLSITACDTGKGLAGVNVDGLFEPVKASAAVGKGAAVPTTPGEAKAKSELHTWAAAATNIIAFIFCRGCRADRSARIVQAEPTPRTAPWFVHHMRSLGVRLAGALGGGDGHQVADERQEQESKSKDGTQADHVPLEISVYVPQPQLVSSVPSHRSPANTASFVPGVDPVLSPALTHATSPRGAAPSPTKAAAPGAAPVSASGIARTRGSGLGLPVARMMARALGGDADLFTETDTPIGLPITRFLFFIPMAAVTPGPDGQAPVITPYPLFGRTGKLGAAGTAELRAALRCTLLCCLEDMREAMYVEIKRNSGDPMDTSEEKGDVFKGACGLGSLFDESKPEESISMPGPRSTSTPGGGHVPIDVPCPPCLDAALKAHGNGQQSAAAAVQKPSSMRASLLAAFGPDNGQVHPTAPSAVGARMDMPVPMPMPMQATGEERKGTGRAAGNTGANASSGTVNLDAFVGTALSSDSDRLSPANTTDGWNDPVAPGTHSRPSTPALVNEHTVSAPGSVHSSEEDEQGREMAISAGPDAGDTAVEQAHGQIVSDVLTPVSAPVPAPMSPQGTVMAVTRTGSSRSFRQQAMPLSPAAHLTALPIASGFVRVLPALTPLPSSSSTSSLSSSFSSHMSGRSGVDMGGIHIRASPPSEASSSFFSVSTPMDGQQGEGSTSIMPAAPRPVIHVLYADDDGTNRRLMERMLGRLGKGTGTGAIIEPVVQLTIANDGWEALCCLYTRGHVDLKSLESAAHRVPAEDGHLYLPSPSDTQAAAGKPPFDLILLDIDMPKMTGDMTAAVLRQALAFAESRSHAALPSSAPQGGVSSGSGAVTAAAPTIVAVTGRSSGFTMVESWIDARAGENKHITGSGKRDSSFLQGVSVVTELPDHVLAPSFDGTLGKPFKGENLSTLARLTWGAKARLL